MNKDLIFESPRQIRIYGAGGHALVIKDLLRNNDIEISNVFDDNPKYSHKGWGNVFEGLKREGTPFPHQGAPFIIAIGDNKQRAKIADDLKSCFSTAVHPTAIVSESAILREGTVVFAGAIIQANATIGKHVIVNTGACIDHDCKIHDFVHIAPNATLCGGIKIGEGTTVGAGAVITPNIKIGKWSTIGAGSVIIKDVPDYATVVGNPGRITPNK